MPTETPEPGTLPQERPPVTVNRSTVAPLDTLSTREAGAAVSCRSVVTPLPAPRNVTALSTTSSFVKTNSPAPSSTTACSSASAMASVIACQSSPPPGATDTFSVPNAEKPVNAIAPATDRTQSLIFMKTVYPILRQIVNLIPATPHPRERSCAISTEYQTPNTKDRPRRHNSKNLHLLPNWHQAIASARSQADADPETTCVPAACGSPCCGSPDAPTVPAAGPRSDVRSCDRRHPNDTADRGQRGGSS